MQTVEAIRRLYKIFRENNWAEKDIDEFVFNNFCTLFENVEEDERSLILELTERYSWISYAEYQARIVNLLDSIEQDKLDKLKKIYFFPIIKPEDEGKNKSGSFVCYLIKGLHTLLKKYKNIRFSFPTKFETLTGNNFQLKDSEALFLVDDYIGSGETLISCLSTLQENANLKNTDINVISIVTQKDILDKMNDNGISFYSSIISRKGISDFNVSPTLDEKVNMMLNIEKLIPGGSHFSLGYNRSEALITMMRTPDNTFPIFWKTYRKEGKKYEAPFSREEYLDE